MDAKRVVKTIDETTKMSVNGRDEWTWGKEGAVIVEMSRAYWESPR
jgi:hypothetical protein